MTIKAAIIGPGKIAGAFGNRADSAGKPPFTHAHAITANDSYQLSAVVGIDDAETNAFANRWDIPGRYTDLDKMLDTEAADLIVITTPDDTHADTIVAALDHPKAPKIIIAEKPLCSDATELARIDAALISTHDTTLLVNQSLRMTHNFAAVRDIIASGDLGDPMMARWVYYGGWMHNGVHLVDMLPLVFDDEAKLISAKQGCIDRADDPCINATFDVGGVPVHLESTPEYAYQLGEGEIRLTGGRIRMADFCTEIHIDKPVKNNIGEVELKPSHPLELPARPAPMERLYQLCADFLVSGDNQVISLIGADTIRPTMNHLFNAIDLIKDDA